MKFLIEYYEHYVDADGYIYVDYGDIVVTSDSKDNAIEIFKDSHPSYIIDKMEEVTDNVELPQKL